MEVSMESNVTSSTAEISNHRYDGEDGDGEPAAAGSASGGAFGGGTTPKNDAAGGSGGYSNEYVLNFAFLSFIGFVCFQAVFSIIANSQAMMADSEAMAVDALTYLFNLVAERIKNRPLSEKEVAMAPAALHRHREIRRLYLELVPPSVSVVTLIAVTISTLREACHTLRGIESESGDDDDDVSILIMLVFSGANLLLDVANVACFARADVAFGLDVVRQEGYSIRESIRDLSLGVMGGGSGAAAAPSSSSPGKRENGDVGAAVANETTALVIDENEATPAAAIENDDGGELAYRTGALWSSTGRHRRHLRSSRRRISSSRLTPEQDHDIVNLNMCSAWTHVCADTLRSAAVLIAAGFAFVLPQIQPDVADSVAAIIVSFIILCSLLPLLQGLCLTSLELHSLLRNPAPTPPTMMTAKGISC